MRRIIVAGLMIMVAGCASAGKQLPAAPAAKAEAVEGRSKPDARHDLPKQSAKAEDCHTVRVKVVDEDGGVTVEPRQLCKRPGAWHTRV